MFRKNQFFNNIFTFLSVIRKNFEDNLRILANFGKFSCKNSKIYRFRPYVFKKLVYFLVFFNKDYTFYTKNLFIRPKNCVQSIFYNETCKEFRKNQCSSNVFKKLLSLFLYFLIKILLFTQKIYLFGPNIAFKAFFSTKDAKSFVKIYFLVTFLHF